MNYVDKYQLFFLHPIHLQCLNELLFYHLKQDDLRKEDFSTMDAQLLYKMIKSKTEYPLHKAIKVEREDVVFLYLIEMDAQVRSGIAVPLSSINA